MSKTLIGKLLAVVVAVASVVFMGFALATTYGGPNWALMAQGQEFDGYKIIYREGENPVWIATRAVDESQVASSPLLPQVLVKVMDDIQSTRQQEIARMKESESRLKEKAEQLRVTSERDEQALRDRVEELQQGLADVRKETNDTAVRVLAATAEAQKIENLISLRREDVFRMEREVTEVQADRFRLDQLRKQLEDLLKQVEGDLVRAQERHQELDRKLNGN